MSPTLTQQTLGNELHTEVTRFYAAQMQLLDRRAAVEWADTFTEDGVFQANGLPEPSRGREAIAAGALRAGQALEQAGLVHRHWLGMVTVDEQPDGTVTARSYALVLQIPLGGEAKIHRSTVCQDVLVRAEDGTLLVLERTVTRDDLG